MSGGIAAGSNAITTNESLPVVSLSKNIKDKKCFGVISTSEDPDKREEKFGIYVTTYDKELGDTRVYINSVGEGAIWVTNINGPLESGDYITTSNVAGYGMKQDDDILHNYTVAKITMDCTFEPPDIPVQRIVKEKANVVHWYTLNTVDFATWSNLSQKSQYSDVEIETYYSVDSYVQVFGNVDQQSNVFIEPEVYDEELYTKTLVNLIEQEVYNNLPETEQQLYTENENANTYVYSQTIRILPDTWDELSPEEQNTYSHGYYNIVAQEVDSEHPGAEKKTKNVYKEILSDTTVEPVNTEGYVSKTIEEWVNVLDEHGQLQWEDVPWGETEKGYKLRYLDADGNITTRHNAVFTAAFVGCTYHCG